jgi:hypothetical protein
LNFNIFNGQILIRLHQIFLHTLGIGSASGISLASAPKINK